MADPTRAEIVAVARTRYVSALQSTESRQTYLTFGRLTVIGDNATLQVNFVCVPLCGHGEALTLKSVDGSWQVIAVRTTWVS